MGMITELELVQQVVVGGEKIKVHKWSLNNVHLHQFLHTLSRAQLGLIETDANNASSFVNAEASAMLQSAWTQAKFEWDLAKRWRGLEQANLEKTFNVLAITDNECMRIPNTKVQRVCYAIATILHKVVYCDSAKMQYAISDANIRVIERQMAYVDAVISAYMGTGVEKDDGSADVGMDVPDYAFVGTVKPPLNLHQVTVSEPSPSAPDIPAMDAPDTASTVPSPGSSTDPVAATARRGA